MNNGAVVNLVIDATGNIADPGTTPIVPDAHIVFVITNNHNQKHRVSVLPYEFKKKKPANPDDPMDPFTQFWADVEAKDIGAIVLRVRPSGHFGNPNGFKYGYKYIIHWSNSKLDPEIEINN